jgi:hypothetical protein
METDADRLASIKALGGQLVSAEHGDFWAIFDNDYLPAAGGMVESVGPALSCRTSDVETMPKGSTVLVGSTTYRIARAESDGTGMTLLVLGR